jgi:two-component system chemotaxis response regulator CheB
MNTKLDQIRVVVIGASAGGVSALHQILPAFKNRKIAVIVVLHMPPEGPNVLPELYANKSSFRIKEAESGESMVPGTIYFPPPDYHLSAEGNGTLSLSNERQINFSRPSIDVLFESVAFAYKAKALAILLTGANNDGAEGIKTISKFGGVTIVQDPLEAEFPLMPQSALERMTPNHILTIQDIVRFIEGMS